MVVIAVAALALAGCADGGTARPTIPSAYAGKIDINPMAAAELRDGGELRWPLEYIPDSFNRYQPTGTSHQTEMVTDALMPRAFRTAPDGKPKLDTEYLVSADLTNQLPQTVTYVIQPAATWSDGTPITWRDFEAQWKALTGAYPGEQTVREPGYGEIASVTRGSDDKHVVVTFADQFPEWQGLFSPLYPASTNANPAVFNTGWLRKIPTTAGPFKVQEVNALGNTVTVVRNERWWGPRPKLDKITFKVVLPADLPDALLRNEIDFYPVETSGERLRRAQTTPGVVIRQATERGYDELIVNGGPGAILADVQLRRAIARGIDRQAITKKVIGQVAPNARQLGNHLFPANSWRYTDNSGVLPYDSAAAGQDLDALGWVKRGDRRFRGATPLQVRLVTTAGDPVGDLVANEVREQLFRIGVVVVPAPLPGPAKDIAMRTSNFDLMLVGGSTSNTPLASARPQFYQPVGADLAANYGRIYNQQIDDDLGEAVEEPDETQRATMADGVDQLIWTVVHSLPLYADPGIYAVRDTLANFGAPGLTEVDYSAIGFIQ